MWHGQSVSDSYFVNTGVSNKALYSIPQGGNMYADFVNGPFAAASVLMNNSVINGANAPFPQFTLFESRATVSMRSNTSPGGSDVEAFILTPRRAISGGDSLTNLIATSMSQTAIAPIIVNQTATPFNDPTVTLYQMPTVTSHFKIKRLWRGRLLVGEEKILKIVKRFGHGHKVTQLKYQQATSTTSVAQGLQACTEDKPFFIVVRHTGFLGHGTAVNPVSAGLPPSSLTFYSRIAYRYAIAPNVPMFQATTIGQVIPAFSAAPIVGVSGAIAQVG